METIKTPFSPEQVEKLNQYQKEGKFHPFTCCSQDDKECERSSGRGEGLLTATVDGWVCPCGKYTQNWAHKFMSE
jgi:hypothetical protein